MAFKAYSVALDPTVAVDVNRKLAALASSGVLLNRIVTSTQIESRVKLFISREFFDLMSATEVRNLVPTLRSGSRSRTLSRSRS